ncbi:DUF5691 domain-containing protein [Gordonia phthalatica]|uniref:Uncharacterized protein n=1 Tax=Gordonia phthalatica TaxID=1136941 RepID=A0A0N7FUR5_9ACTN|nr:DUF5691 domain-containing protein [Gordonia phthalatica]ALG85095.1 hypothetical protein ACH46_12160 [Gordonia phthalatica]
MTTPTNADDSTTDGSAARWRDALLSTAVLGTDRRPPPTPPTAVGTGGHRADEPPVEMLDQAALAAALTRAGRTSTVAEPAAAAPAETSPYAPPRAVELLGVLLDAPPVAREVWPDLLERWLDTAGDRGVLVPPPMLPAVIAAGGRSPRLQPALRRSWGRRGDWLAEVTESAGKRPAHLDAESLTRDWTDLAPSVAVDALVELRSRDPAGARTIALAQWSGLPAALKERVVTGFQVGLSLADEAFLEDALDQRSVRVRDAARTVLRHLPGSAFGRRMADRLRPLVTVQRGRVLRSHVTITLLAPTALDDAAHRDGLPGTGSATDRSASLQAIVASAPLHTWTDLSGLTADQVVAGLRDDTAAITALIRAATQQSDGRWAHALLAVRDHRSLVPVLPPAERERHLLRLLPVCNDVAFQELLAVAGHPWSVAVAHTILARVTRPAAPKDTASTLSRRVAHLPMTYATAFPAESVPAISEVLARAELPTSGVAVPDHLRRVLATAINFHALDQSIQEAFS